jgi:hypothetical protein
LGREIDMLPISKELQLVLKDAIGGDDNRL